MKTLYIREALTSKRTTKSKLKAIVMIYYHFGGLRFLFSVSCGNLLLQQIFQSRDDHIYLSRDP